MQPQDEPESDELNLTPDDELEDSRADPLDSQIGDEPLPEDFDPPASNPTDISEEPSLDMPTIDDTHPTNDTDVDEAEVYDQGY